MKENIIIAVLFVLLFLVVGGSAFFVFGDQILNGEHYEKQVFYKDKDFTIEISDVYPDTDDPDDYMNMVLEKVGKKYHEEFDLQPERYQTVSPGYEKLTPEGETLNRRYAVTIIKAAVAHKLALDLKSDEFHKLWKEKGDQILNFKGNRFHHGEDDDPQGKNLTFLDAVAFTDPPLTQRVYEIVPNP